MTTHNALNIKTTLPPAGFEPTKSATERPQTYALDRAATGTGKIPVLSALYSVRSVLPAKLILNIFPCNLTFNDYNSKLSQCKSANRPPQNQQHNYCSPQIRWNTCHFPKRQTSVFRLSLMLSLRFICQFLSGCGVFNYMFI